MPKLLDSITLAGRTARNRLVLPPMLTMTEELDGQPTLWHRNYYAQRAKDGAGIVIVECTAVCREMRNSPGELGLYAEEQIEPMGALAKAIQASGALALTQLHHAGRITPASINAHPEAPSEEVLEDGRQVRAMTEADIQRAIENFAAAAKRAAQAGFDGVELHGCHRYLLNQFVSPTTNRRDDAWGGDFARRMAFPLAVIAAVRRALPEGMILGYRMGFNDPDATAGPAIARALRAAGVDYLHVSSGIGPGEMPEDKGDVHGFWCAAKAVKQAVAPLPVIAVAGIGTLDQAEAVVCQDYADMAAVGRPYLINADWLSAQQEGRDIVPCLRCQGGCKFLGGKCPHAKEIYADMAQMK